ncbi:type II toxin-antitoxin system YoeB family toxin [Microcoleus sp. D2_18a_D3]|uniref:type II toxin-antitoxin system YoeB family toxin n=1 Tax=Microcoleus sp. D2_18a_D3 TaxID=3055330 RepID=UPI002FD583A2
MTRKLAWTDEAWGDYLYWQGQDKKTLKRINKLIEATIRLRQQSDWRLRGSESQNH